MKTAGRLIDSIRFGCLFEKLTLKISRAQKRVVAGHKLLMAFARMCTKINYLRASALLIFGYSRF